MAENRNRTTVSIDKTTKAKLDKWRAKGQCYDGFLYELVVLWEKIHKRNSIEEIGFNS
jgi:hypothetical protein